MTSPSSPPVAATPVDGPCTPRAAHGALRPLPFDAVRLSADGMLGAWQERNRARVLPHVLERLETSGVLDNLRIAAGRAQGEFRGFNFADSDLHKTLEALAWEAGRVPDAQPWEDFVVAAADLLAAAQRDDGYLCSHVQLTAPGAELTALRWSHELYVLGHLLQAAVARARTTGRTDLLDVATRFADLVDARLGPDGAEGYDGHPEVETALVELYRLTGERRWLDLARRQVDLRGRGLLGSGPFPPAYHQDHVPVREASEVAGHAVRQLYLLAGVADVAAETGEQALVDALVRLWDSAEGTRTYVTGGLGARHKDESFGDAHELPSDRAYAETCAAIALVHWAWRMLLLTGEPRYADAMERTLVNAVAAAVGLDGRSFTYSNPLQLRSGHDGTDEYHPSGRLDWFACACCPPNLARLAASLHAYVATVTDDAVQLHLYAAGDVRVPDDGTVLRVRTDYPWDGRVEVTADPAGAPLVRDLTLRVPAWADPAAATLTVDGRPVPLDARDGRVTVPASPDAPVRTVVLDLPMPVVALTAHPHADAVRGCVALRRGPVVWALEQADLPDGVVLEDVAVVAGAQPVDGPPAPVLGAPVGVRVAGVHRPTADAPPWRASGTVPALPGPSGGTPLELRLVPYHAWGNRGPGAMRVWLPVSAAGAGAADEDADDHADDQPDDHGVSPHDAATAALPRCAPDGTAVR